MEAVRAVKKCGFQDRDFARVFVVLCIAFGPMVFIGAISELDRAQFRGVLTQELSLFSIAKHILGGSWAAGLQSDSWLVMNKAIIFLSTGAHDRLYEELFFKSGVRFQYPPSSLIGIELLSAVGIRKFQTLNELNSFLYIINSIVVGIICWDVARTHYDCETSVSRRASSLVRSPAFALAIAAGCSVYVFYPIVRAQLLGQIQVWIDLLYSGAVLFWLRSQRYAAGLLIGLACTIKPQLGLLIVWGILWGERRFVLGAISTFVPVMILAVFRYGVHNNIEYLRVLSFLSQVGEGYFANNSFNGVLHWYFGGENYLVWMAQTFPKPNNIVTIGSAFASFVFLSLLFIPGLVRDGRAPSPSEFFAATICSVVSSPVAWEHHYGILLPVFVYLVAAELGPIKSREAAPMMTLRRTAIFISWVLVSSFIPFTSLLVGTPLSLLAANFLIGALILLVVLRSEKPDVFTPLVASTYATLNLILRRFQAFTPNVANQVPSSDFAPTIQMLEVSPGGPDHPDQGPNFLRKLPL